MKNEECKCPQVGEIVTVSQILTTDEKIDPYPVGLRAKLGCLDGEFVFPATDGTGDGTRVCGSAEIVRAQVSECDLHLTVRLLERYPTPAT